MTGIPDERAGGGRALWLMFAVLFLVAAFLGAWGLTQLDQPDSRCPPPDTRACRYPAADIAYFDAQLFLLASEPLQDGGPFPLPLEVARFLAPFATAYGVTASVWNILVDRRHRRAARRAQEHAVVVGDDPFALTITTALRAAGTTVIRVTGDADQHAQGLVVVGDAWKPATLRAAGVPRATTVYACLADNAANAAVVAAVAALTGEEGDHPEPLACYARISDGELALALKARRLGLSAGSGFRLDFFTPEEIAARKLATHILEPHLGTGDPLPSVAVVGLGPFGRALIVALARLWRVRSGAPPLPLVLVDTHASAQLAELRTRYPPVAAHCAPRVRDEPATTVDLGTVLPEPPSAGASGDAGTLGIRHLVLCDQNEDTVLPRALNTTRNTVDVGQIVTVCTGQRTALGDLLNPRLLDSAPGEVRIFAITDEAAEPDELRNDTLTVLARAIHEQYLIDEQAKGRTIGSAEPMDLWDDLRDDLRAANYRQAEDIGVKLGKISAVVVPMTDPPTDFSFTPAEIDLLARHEHERWCAERRGQGWTFAPVRDDSRRRHNLLVDWLDLPDDQRAKAIATVRHLPALLADHGLQILRLG
ncbi:MULTISPECIES: RyR domain-containing protein [Protofrankia]|uniref:Ryanodine receptor Ryr n=1 Tax=Candidatus Protofrankia datiscae TaxID=2716812 RepID=F8B690_9ACTN|nr:MULTISPECIES: RyR domain-containing protein [Protofrankia]AEH08060.1 Ryanodine receptor Ryr [Candidatus Protofrankia datiscae]